MLRASCRPFSFEGLSAYGFGVLQVLGLLGFGFAGGLRVDDSDFGAFWLGFRTWGFQFRTQSNLRLRVFWLST